MEHSLHKLPSPYVNAREVAEYLPCSLSWVYAHREDLGGIKLDGKVLFYLPTIAGLKERNKRNGYLQTDLHAEEQGKHEEDGGGSAVPLRFSVQGQTLQVNDQRGGRKERVSNSEESPSCGGNAKATIADTIKPPDSDRHGLREYFGAVARQRSSKKDGQVLPRSRARR